MYVYTQKLFNATISAKTVRHAHQVLQKAIDYAQNIKSKFLLVKGIQQIEFDTVMPTDATDGCYAMTQLRLANITCFKCEQKGYYSKRLSQLG